MLQCLFRGEHHRRYADGVGGCATTMPAAQSLCKRVHPILVSQQKLAAPAGRCNALHCLRKRPLMATEIGRYTLTQPTNSERWNRQKTEAVA